MRITISKVIIFSILLLLPVFLHAENSVYLANKKNIVKQFKGRIPNEWGEKLPGVKTHLITNDKAIALTFDACGSKNDGYDEQLINFLIAQKIPATLFINSRWIDKHRKEFNGLVASNLFEIENHGLNHKPASVNGKSKYGIKGTASVSELFDEVEKNALKIESLTGKKPYFYRSGTAYYDDVAVKVIEALGYEIAGFSVLGDAGATYKKEQVKEALLSAQPGSIVICHMNHPEGETAEGIIEAIPLLKKQGFKFVTLSAYALE